MASSNQTAQFALNQWAASDQVLREDFNRDNQILETNLNKLSFIFGSYTGTGTGVTQTINLGVPLALIIVFPAAGSTSLHAGAATAQVSENQLTVSGSSFTVASHLNAKPTDTTGLANPYRYVAWRS